MDIPILEFFRISFNLCGSQDVRCHKNSVLTGDGRKNTIKFDVPSFLHVQSDKPQCLVNYFGEATSFKWWEWLDFRWVEFFNSSCQCPIHDYWVWGHEDKKTHTRRLQSSDDPFLPTLPPVLPGDYPVVSDWAPLSSPFPSATHRGLYLPLNIHIHGIVQSPSASKATYTHQHVKLLNLLSHIPPQEWA